MSSKTPLEYSFRIHRVRFTALLGLLVLVLIANHTMLQIFHYRWQRGHWLIRNLFDVDAEDSIPTWCSTALLLLSAALLFLIASVKTREADGFARHWSFLAFGFLLLSLDEVAGLHESLNTVLDFSWTIPGAVVVAVIGLLFVRFLWHLPRRTCAGFLVAGGIFVTGAVGVEHSADWYLEAHSMNSLGYNLLTGLEEGLEMFGVVVFIGELLHYIERGPVATIPIIVEETHEAS